MTPKELLNVLQKMQEILDKTRKLFGENFSAFIENNQLSPLLLEIKKEVWALENFLKELDKPIYWD